MDVLCIIEATCKFIQPRNKRWSGSTLSCLNRNMLFSTSLRVSSMVCLKKNEKYCLIMYRVPQYSVGVSRVLKLHLRFCCVHVRGLLESNTFIQGGYALMRRCLSNSQAGSLSMYLEHSLDTHAIRPSVCKLSVYNTTIRSTFIFKK